MCFSVQPHQQILGQDKARKMYRRSELYLWHHQRRIDHRRLSPDDADLDFIRPPNAAQAKARHNLIPVSWSGGHWHWSISPLGLLQFVQWQLSKPRRYVLGETGTFKCRGQSCEHRSLRPHHQVAARALHPILRWNRLSSHIETYHVKVFNCFWKTWSRRKLE